MKTDGYFTKNLNIASYLYASGLQLIGTKTNNREVYFLFSPEDKAKNLVDGYFSGNAQVNPANFLLD
jgi:hypothetical protein